MMTNDDKPKGDLADASGVSEGEGGEPCAEFETLQKGGGDEIENTGIYQG